MTDLTEQGHRLEELLKFYKMKQITLSQRLRISRGYVSNLVSGKTAITRNVYDGLQKCFPLLNMNWLMRGEGEMLLRSYGSNDVMSAVREPDGPKESDVFSDLRRVLEYYKERIDNLEKRVSQLEGRIK